MHRHVWSVGLNISKGGEESAENSLCFWFFFTHTLNSCTAQAPAHKKTVGVVRLFFCWNGNLVVL